jgi:mannose-1-phosphate guanylyltransferase
MLIPVILAGGVGSRLWPLSRDLYPKQLLSLIGEQSLLQATVTRVLQIPNVTHVIIVCNQQYQFLVQEQLEALQQTYNVTFDLILEPMGKNTAPALALAALRAAEFAANDPFLLALPADHLIEDTAAFANQLQQILPKVGNKLLTFGIKPHYPETGYGYMEVSDLNPAGGISAIKRFIEKPDIARAETYCKQAGYYWNSGIFLYRTSSYLSELQRYSPDILACCQEVWAHNQQQSESIYLDANLYRLCPDISIDYAIMEKTQNAMMTPLCTGWDDVGSWLAVANIESSDEQANVCLGDVVALDSENCYLRSESRLLAVVGLKNQIVVETSDAVLVADKSQAQNVKRLVEKLKHQKRKEAESHSVLYQPWGHYEILCTGAGFIVKQLTIKPRGLLSASTDSLTCEHWVVLNGVVHVLVDGMSSLLSVNQFIDILPAVSYRFENDTASAVKILCIQTTLDS